MSPDRWFHRDCTLRQLRHVAFALAAAAVVVSTSTQAAGDGHKHGKHTHGAHAHGVVNMTVAVEPSTAARNLTVTLDLPLDNLVGFERPPRNDKERAAADQAMTRLREAKAMVTPPDAAQCSASEVDVRAAVLEPGAKAKGEHAEAQVRYVFDCKLPQQLTELQLGVMDAFARIQRVQAQVAGAAAQSKVTVRRPAKTLRLAR